LSNLVGCQSVTCFGVNVRGSCTEPRTGANVLQPLEDPDCDQLDYPSLLRALKVATPGGNARSIGKHGQSNDSK
jgi:hypothetical protein